MCIDKTIIESSLTAVPQPTVSTMSFTPEQEEARKAAKEGKLGIKFDDDPDKLRWDLMPWREAEQVVEILTFGAIKYADDNWKYVSHSRRRYFAAAMRHFIKWFMGQKYDKDSGKNHLAHALCCIMFLLYFDNENENKKDDENNK
jgi:hypothetical protein